MSKWCAGCAGACSANKVRNFARPGYEAKTDVLDARVLSRYGEVFQLASRLPDDGDGQELKELLKRRKELVDQRVQERLAWRRACVEGRADPPSGTSNGWAKRSP